MEVGDLVGSVSKFADDRYPTVLKFKSCPVQLSYKVAESDKIKMAEDLCKLQAHRNSRVETFTPVTSGGLPPLVNLPDDMEGWTTYDKPILYVYAGKGPFVGRYRERYLCWATKIVLISEFRDYMAFPVSQPDDGLIDVMVHPVVRLESFSGNPPTDSSMVQSSRKEMLSSLGGAARGETYWQNSVRYFWMTQ